MFFSSVNLLRGLPVGTDSLRNHSCRDTFSCSLPDEPSLILRIDQQVITCSGQENVIAILEIVLPLHKTVAALPEGLIGWMERTDSINMLISVSHKLTMISHDVILKKARRKVSSMPTNIC